MSCSQLQQNYPDIYQSTVDKQGRINKILLQDALRKRNVNYDASKTVEQQCQLLLEKLAQSTQVLATQLQAITASAIAPVFTYSSPFSPLPLPPLASVNTSTVATFPRPPMKRPDFLIPLSHRNDVFPHRNDEGSKREVTVAFEIASRLDDSETETETEENGENGQDDLDFSTFKSKDPTRATHSFQTTLANLGIVLDNTPVTLASFAENEKKKEIPTAMIIDSDRNSDAERDAVITKLKRLKRIEE